MDSGHSAHGFRPVEVCCCEIFEQAERFLKIINFDLEKTLPKVYSDS